ncbi:MAG TPA: hypothetical protein VFR41_03855 [Acidimicrobiia bacterium]|nr:hypothetical protein [Acidimicrobiia bacterium]
MSVLAALLVGLACGLAGAAWTGTMPPFTLPRISLPAPDRRIAVASTIVTLVTFAVAWRVSGSPFVAVVPAFAAGMVPRGAGARRAARRRRDLQTAWPDGLRDLVAAVASGASLTQAVTALARHGPLQLRSAFGRFETLARVVGTAPALEIVQAQLADPVSDRVIEVLMLAHERGGAIVRTVLEDLVVATTRDLELLDELDADGLEMRINARAVVVLPWLVLVALTARPGPFRDFYRSGGGVATLTAAGALTLVGVTVLRKLGREPIEPRVVGAA